MPAARLKPTRPKIIKGAVPDQSLDWPICWPAVLLIADIEKLTLEAYVCPAGVATNGWGETEGVYMGMPAWTEEYADQRYLESLRERAAVVDRLVNVPLNANQLGALVCLVYNIGEGNFRTSTVLRCINRGDYAAASRAFGLFNQATVDGKRVVMAGLTARRAKEAAMFLTPVPADEVMPDAAPQAVAPESSMAKSPINQTSLIGGGVSALGLLSGVGDGAEDVNASLTKVTTATTGAKGLLADFGLTGGQVICGVGLAVAGVCIYQRFKQRSDGWA